MAIYGWKVGFLKLVRWLSTLHWQSVKEEQTPDNADTEIFPLINGHTEAARVATVVDTD